VALIHRILLAWALDTTDSDIVVCGCSVSVRAQAFLPIMAAPFVFSCCVLLLISMAACLVWLAVPPVSMRATRRSRIIRERTRKLSLMSGSPLLAEANRRLEQAGFEKVLPEGLAAAARADNEDLVDPYHWTYGNIATG
jgi:hypothetical protein